MGPFILELEADTPFDIFEPLPGTLLREMEMEITNHGMSILVPGGRGRAIVDRGGHMEIHLGNSYVGTIDYRFVRCVKNGARVLLWERPENVVH